MAYIDDYVDGVRYGALRIDKKKLTDSELSQLKMWIAAVASRNDEEFLSSLLTKITSNAKEFVWEISPENLFAKCHAYTHLFSKKWLMYLAHEAPGLNFGITIGNVLFKGEMLYTASRSSLKKELRKGYDSDDKLDFHVWLTLPDSSVLDLTIMANLLGRGELTRDEYDKNPVIHWDDGEQSDFEYRPLLVHNEFVPLIDVVM